MLRKLEEKDIPFMVEWMKDDKINRFFRFNPDDITENTARAFIAEHQNIGNDYHFAITDESDEYMGTISLKNVSPIHGHGEYAIALRSSAQGKGLAYKATKELLDYAFNSLNLNRVFLNVLSDNHHAISFYEKIGFRCEGEFVDHLVIKGIVHSLKWYAITREEYKSADVFRNQTQIITLPIKADPRGALVIAEGQSSIPFGIKRLFYIYGCDSSSVRGNHANIKSKFAFITVKGSCKVRAKDGKALDQEYLLDSPEKCLYMPQMIWKEMYDFSEDCVLLVISSEHYDKNEYINDYEEFQKAAIGK